MINLDTNIVIAFLDGKLTELERAALQDDPRWIISPMVLWEVDVLYRKDRLRYAVADPGLMALVERYGLFPPDLATCRALSRLDFRSDPADELIAATSVAHGIPLLTRDGRLRASKVVPLAL